MADRVPVPSVFRCTRQIYVPGGFMSDGSDHRRCTRQAQRAVAGRSYCEQHARQAERRLRILESADRRSSA